MSAFLIIQGNVTNWNKFKGYTAVVPDLVTRFGGKYIAMGTPEILEGDTTHMSAVISQWPTKRAIHDFWHSIEYQQTKVLREGAGTFNVMIVESLPITSKE
jgi:uncharacterized protein (DUF1330 family)